jgi:Rha family phage regulatory protein
MLPIIQENQPLTMSSREIADLTGKSHSNVMRDIRVMITEIEQNSDLNFVCSDSFYISESSGQKYPAYELDRETTDCLLTGYSAVLRMRVINRWKALENQLKPQVPTNFAEALQLAADQAKLIEQQSEKIAIDKPKVEFVDKLVDKSNVMNATTIAQKHGKSAIWLNKILKEHDVYSKAIKRGKVFRQWFIQKKFGEMKQTEMGYSQAMFTNAGEIWINELLIAHGYV